MEDETDLLSNLCTDLISLRRLEPGLEHLFRDIRPGNWTQVRELFRRAGQPNPDVKAQLAAAWLPSPGGADYAVVVFFDDDTKWSLTADYNITRLLGTRPTSQDVAVAG